jgi:hypothetical protein
VRRSKRNLARQRPIALEARLCANLADWRALLGRHATE